MFKSLFLFILIFFIPSASAVVVLKTKEKKALVLLEGLRTQKGAYFDVFDLYGNKKGLVQMDRVAETKAIVELKSGSIAKKWSLQPVTKELALYELKKDKRRRTRVARIHREQIKRRAEFKMKQLEKAKKRRLALKRQLEREKERKLAFRRALNKKRRLAQKKKAIQRKLASYNLEENILVDLGEETGQQSPEILSYETPESFNSVEKVEEESNKVELSDNFEPVRDKPSPFSIGILPRAEYNFMKVTPISADSYFMDGLGFGAVLSAGVSLNRFMELGLNVGAKRFSIFAEEEECGQSKGCSLLVYYALAGLNLKFNLINFNGHKLWLMGEGSLLRPLAYSNKVPNLTKESFSPFHGTVGGGLGLEFNFGNLTMPISIDTHVNMPPTQTTLTGSLGLQFGLSYKF